NITKERSVYESLLFWFLLAAIIILAFAVTIYRYFSRKNEELLKKQEEDRQFINQIMRAFAKCIDMRDTQNRGHSFRVAYYTRLLAEKLSETRGYTEEQIEEFYNIALLHDIGKIGIEDKVLNKTERLNDEEFLIMKTHAAKGEDMLKGVKVLRDFAIGAGYHHERMDGKGYPHGLKGTEIPEVARVIAVADTFDAMYSTRPYRKQLELSVVLEELKRIKGSQLEGEVVDAMLKLAEEGKLDKEKADASAVDAPETDADNSSKGKCGNENSVVSDSDSGDEMDEDRKFLDDLGLGGPKK
ncbi:MAG: HD-GYP domain-containing protein, partial [Lachnospiraceae bacterium]|nr:HD-GYP domain-containing protein [Lachnospiraceae bacterium]